MDDQWPGLTDQQWDAIKGLLPRYKRPYFRAQRRGGRPRASDKKVFEAILWTMRGENHIERLPERFGRRRTVCRRLDQWLRNDSLFRLWNHYLDRLADAEIQHWSDLISKRSNGHFWQGMMAASVRFRRPPVSRGS